MLTTRDGDKSSLKYDTFSRRNVLLAGGSLAAASAIAASGRLRERNPRSPNKKRTPSASMRICISIR
jgi:hypothetical protein